jgi:hypothetical protein
VNAVQLGKGYLKGRTAHAGQENIAKESVETGHPGFRVILSAGTRPLKQAKLGLVTHEPRRVDLRKEPRGHR